MNPKSFYRLILWLVLLLTASGAIADEKSELGLISPFSGSLGDAGYDVELLDLQWQQLETFYTRHPDRLIWHDGGMLNALGSALVEFIASVGGDGLTPSDYHLETIGYFSSYTLGKTRALRELVLTDAYIRLARDMQLGRVDPHEVDTLWRMQDEHFDAADYLENLLRRDSKVSTMDWLRPEIPAYARLRQAYEKYLNIAAVGGWPRITVKHTLRPGDADPAVSLLRARLRIEGDYPNVASESPDYYDDQLTEAVKGFQRRNGLRDDGVMGPVTRSVLNVTVQTRLNQLLANLERWRWLPRELGEEFLLVNTAGYEMTLFLEGEPIIHKRTISGRKQRPTPSFKGRISTLVVNPDWTVPRSIAVKDLLPKQQADAGFLDKSRIGVFQWEQGEWVQLESALIDWSQYNEDHFPFLLRQEPGPLNSLGRFKFHMSNPYAIYLHDTPSVGLFRRPIRAFSSGCVRVQDAEHLARYLLSREGQSVEELIDLPLQSGETLITKLSKSVEVYLTYFTSWVDSEGVVQFRPDIYRRNTGLIMALKSGESTLADNQRQNRSKSL